MPYVNPALLIQDRFKSPLESVLPIVPSFMANKRAQEQLAFQQAQALAGAPLRQAQIEKYRQDIQLDPRRLAVQEAANVGLPEYRGAQTNVNRETAAKLKAMNDIRAQLFGAVPTDKPLPFNISPEEYIRSEMNLPQRQMVTGYDKESKTYSRQLDKPGLVTKPETGKMHTLNYWMPGEQSMSSQIVPIEDYDQTVAAIRKAGGIIGTQAPLPIRLKELEETQKIKNAAKLEALKQSLIARGIDTGKFNDQQKAWERFVLRVAQRRDNALTELSWRMSIDDAAIAWQNLEIDLMNQFDLINAGQPPSWLSRGEPTERPLGLPKRKKKDETEQEYQQRVQQTTLYRAVPPVQPQTQGPVKRLPGESVEQYMQRVGQ